MQLRNIDDCTHTKKKKKKKKKKKHTPNLYKDFRLSSLLGVIWEMTRNKFSFIRLQQANRSTMGQERP